MSIYTSLSGAVSQGEKLDLIANNIANANTPSFKKDEALFRTKFIDSSFLEASGVPSLSSQFDIRQAKGKDLNAVQLDRTYTNFKQGTLKKTGLPLDFGLEGPGFFEVLTPRGVRLSRNGHFKLDREGRIVNSSGFPVLLQQRTGVPLNPLQRLIQLGNASSISVSEDGKIYLDRNLLGSFSLVQGDPALIQKEGHSLYVFSSGGGASLRPALQTKVLQGFIEDSNVNIVKEMTDMIQTTRAFDSNKQMIKAYDAMSDKLVNQVSRLR